MRQKIIVGLIVLLVGGVLIFSGCSEYSKSKITYGETEATFTLGLNEEAEVIYKPGGDWATISIILSLARIDINKGEVDLTVSCDGEPAYIQRRYDHDKYLKEEYLGNEISRLKMAEIFNRIMGYPARLS